MNRRNKPAAKKIDFEPKIPIEPVVPISETIQKEEPIEKNSIVEQPVMKGVFAPKTFSIPKNIPIGENEFIFNLPEFFFNAEYECKLVIFSDNSYGIKMDGKIYECDSLYMGDSMIVDLDDKARRVGNPEIILTGYPYSYTK